MSQHRGNDLRLDGPDAKPAATVTSPLKATQSDKEQLHRLIIENRDETGAIDASDQNAMADEILEWHNTLTAEETNAARIDELTEIRDMCLTNYGNTGFNSMKVLADYCENRITQATLKAKKANT